MTSAVESLAGTLLGLFCFALLLYGSATSQMYNYWLNYINDTKLHRRTVAVVWLVDTIHTVFCLIVIYRYIIIDFGQLELLQYIVWYVTVGTEVCAARFVWNAHADINIEFKQASRKNKGLCGCILSRGSGSIAFCADNVWFRYRSYFTYDNSLLMSYALAATVGLISTRRKDLLSMHVVELIQSYVINTGALTMLVSLSIMFTRNAECPNARKFMLKQARSYRRSARDGLQPCIPVNVPYALLTDHQPGIKVTDEDLFASGIPTTGSAGTSIAHDNETNAEPIEKTTRFLSMENDKKVDVELGKETQVFL
ncbi:hypothetical protein POSPLADRAFT_1046102 [Postia placenta MAD-698-R-SB12]|uniref:Uncharacterized protein n=1 Tax=Postia placenta MAD-698-R-SB12 TaxID=670580 RepID=A0A1X6N2I3_9APHY|nr:hypothetical protein POSPLADRAFT_1046102 [Postia placenta MAD-698-R-SB12]OSX62682.1 hypothetical protein POSPLADRAFT_1046102 [Postia placenta MAD-698-R-SB12]